MPKLKKDDPQFPERNSGSFLKSAVAATPLTIGVTSALRGVSIDGSLKQPREAGIDQAMRHIAQRAYNGPPIPSIEEVNRFMNKKPEGLVHQAWQWATGTVDKYTMDRLHNLTEGIGGMTEAEARSAISQTVTGNESAAMGRVWRKFQTNVNLLQTQQIMSGTLPTFTNVENLTAFAQQRTIPLTTPMPTSFSQSVERIASSLGAQKSIYGFTRPEVAGEGFGVWNVIFRGSPTGDIKLQLPQVAGGVLLEGSDLQTRRIAPDIIRLGLHGEVEKIGRTEFFLREFEESILPDIQGGRLKSQRDVEQAVKQLRTKIFGELEAVPNVVAEGRTLAQGSREALRGKAVDVVKALEVRKGVLEYQPGFERPSTDDISRLMMREEGRALGLKGGIGAKGLAQGRLSTVDWERFSIGDVNYGRNPQQVHREFQATQQTLEALKQTSQVDKYRAAEVVGSDLAYENVARPKLKTVYIDPTRHAALMEEMAMGEGEAIMRSSTMSLVQFEESTAKKLMQVREDITDFSKIRAGEVLGITEESKPFILPQGSSITNVRRLTDTTLQVEYMKTHQLRHGDKIFDAAKAVLQERGGREFTEMGRRLGAADMGAQLYANMDELRKNQALHRQQIVSSLEDLTRANWMDSMGRKWAKEASHQEFIKKAMAASMGDFELSRTQFAETFGAVPFVLEDDQLAARLVREAAAEANVSRKTANKMISAMMSTGTAGGNMAISYGGPRIDVGGLGSLEPRAFDIMKGGALGAQGEQLAAEFAERLAITNPEAIVAHTEIDKTMTSLSGGKVDMSGLTEFKTGRRFQEFVESGGGYLKPGKGMPNIYIPGADIMSQMRPFETPSGVTVRGGISDIYHDIAYKTELFQAGDLTREEFKKEMDLASDMLRKEWAPAGKGAGSLTRGKLIGSRFLRGVSAQTGGASTAIREVNTIGITKSTFLDMFGELAKSDMYKNDMKKLNLIKDQFLAGKNVGGVLARHPFLGEFSIQPVMMKMVKGEDDLMVLPEIKQNIRARTALQGEFKEKTLTLGPLIGLAGDKDADAYSAMLVGPRNEEMIRKEILAADSAFANRYAQHQVRMQLFKAGKAGQGTLPTIAQMAADVEKLAVGNKWIAPLSMEITTTKQALTSFGQGQAAADARFLLEWLEQTPISAKHMKALEAAGGGLRSLMESITDALQQRNASRLERNIASIVKDDATAKAMLTGNVYIDKASAENLSRNLNAKIQQELRGINVPAALKEMMRTLSESDASGATRQMQLLAGRGARAKMNEIAELSAKSVFKAIAEPGMFSRISSSMVRANNFLGQAGRGILKHHKAIGFGFAGSLALSAALSSPPETVGPGSAKIPNAKMHMNRRKAADRMKPEDMQPPSQPVGQPTPPQLMRNQTVRMAMSQPRTSAHIRARVNSNVDATALGSQLSGVSGNSSVNLRDSRATPMHPREIANKLL